MEDSYEIQQYMIENTYEAVKPWKVRDTGMEITLEQYDTREEAVAECKRLREQAAAHNAKQSAPVNWLGQGIL